MEQVRRTGWQVTERIQIYDQNAVSDEIWIVRPGQAETPETIEECFKFSIIMPTYRREHTLAHTVATIQAQTYRNWELIIVDNEGTGQYRFDDPRIRVYRHAERTSASYARNQGLKYANGDLVCFFDDDDDMYPKYLQRFAQAFASNPNAKMARAGMVVTDGLVNFTFATPECCLRREFATPTWENHSLTQDQRYFGLIVAGQQWTEESGDIVVIPEALCQAYGNPRGGLRAGRL
jgi:glycosyltransferase involved in cell wall biosynthesis